MNRRDLLKTVALTLVVRPTLELRAEPGYNPDDPFVRLVCFDVHLHRVNLDSPIPRHHLRVVEHRDIPGQVLVYAPPRIKFCNVGADGVLCIDRLELHNFYPGLDYTPGTHADGVFPFWSNGGDVTGCWDPDGLHLPIMIVD